MATMKTIPTKAIQIRAIVKKDQGITDAKWIDGTKGADTVRAKTIVAWICRNKLKMSLRQIAIICGWDATSSAYEAVVRAEPVADAGIGDLFPPFHYGEKYESHLDYAMAVFQMACEEGV